MFPRLREDKLGRGSISVSLPVSRSPVCPGLTCLTTAFPPKVLRIPTFLVASPGTLGRAVPSSNAFCVYKGLSVFYCFSVAYDEAIRPSTADECFPLPPHDNGGMELRLW